MNAAMKGLHAGALALPDTDEGVACEGTAIESRTVKVRGKAFAFFGPGSLRLKLGKSLAKAQAIGAKDARVVAGAGGWIKIVDDGGGALPRAPIAKWIVESYELMAPARAAARAPRRPRAGRSASRDRSRR